LSFKGRTIRNVLEEVGNSELRELFFSVTFVLHESFLSQSSLFFGATWLAWIFFHKIFPCTNIFWALRLPPLLHLTTLIMVRSKIRSILQEFQLPIDSQVAGTYRGTYIRIRKAFHSDLCHLQIERINDNEEGTVDMDMLEEKLQVNPDQTSI